MTARLIFYFYEYSYTVRYLIGCQWSLYNRSVVNNVAALDFFTDWMFLVIEFNYSIYAVRATIYFQKKNSDARIVSEVFEFIMIIILGKLFFLRSELSKCLLIFFLTRVQWYFGSCWRCTHDHVDVDALNLKQMM